MSKYSKKIIIAFEGVDGVGKTTIAKSLAEMNSYVYVKCPLEDTENVKKFYEQRFKKFPISRFLFYLNSLWEVYSFIERYNSDQIFLVDRYILSTKVYHKILFDDLRLDENIKKLILDAPYPPEPLLNIVLVAEQKVRLERILRRRRNLPSIDYSIEENQTLLQKVQDEFIKQNNVRVIETSNKTIDEIVSACKEEIIKSLNSSGENYEK